MVKKGYVQSAQHKANLAAALKKRWADPESRARHSASLVGRKMPDGWRERISKTLRGRKQSPETVAKRMATVRALPKRPYTEAERLRRSAAHRGRKMSTEHYKNYMAARPRGEKNANWRGGKYVDTRLGMRMRVWKKTIWARDNFTCQMCGKRGGILHADHIKAWVLYPELRYDLANGRTLCPPCHRKTPSYGKTARQMLRELGEPTTG